MAHEHLFSSFNLGKMKLKNRIIMAPMTRSRCIDNFPGPLVATYYEQRSSAGLIITEGVSPSPNGVGYPRIPGLYTSDQINGWRYTTDAVHREGGRIFAQLMHTGRISHPLNLPEGGRVLAPSALAAPDPMYTDTKGMQPLPVPEEMNGEDIAAAIAEFVTASQNAIEAGFDGVEIHGANGYLIDQFLNTASNTRTDSYGGPPENRARFAVHVAKAVADAIGAEHVGIRLSPAGGFNGMNTDEDALALYTHLAAELRRLNLAYIHLVDHGSMGFVAPSPEIIQSIRQQFNGALIFSGGYDADRAEQSLSKGECELVAFGRPFISNPNLPAKLKENRSLRDPDFDTFYTPGEKGYTDYPLD